MIPDFDEAHRPPDSETFRAAVGTLRQQEAKGRGKYGTDLDGAGLTAAQLLTHAAEESADLLMYLTALKSHATLDQQIAGDWESAYRGACKDRDALAARVAELEAELSATERTADAERERAKRAERLLESESALVAELEASVTYEHNRFKARGGELDRLDERVAELERSLSSTETHRQSLAHELSRAQALDEASLKTIARKDRRIGELEAENATLRERLDYYGGFADPDRPFADPPDFAHPSPAPTTRPLTTADRLPEIGDVLAIGAWRFTVDDRLRDSMEDEAFRVAAVLPYVSRADGGPVTVEAQP